MNLFGFRSNIKRKAKSNSKSSGWRSVRFFNHSILLKWKCWPNYSAFKPSLVKVKAAGILPVRWTLSRWRQGTSSQNFEGLMLLVTKNNNKKDKCNQGLVFVQQVNVTRCVWSLLMTHRVIVRNLRLRQS